MIGEMDIEIVEGNQKVKLVKCTHFKKTRRKLEGGSEEESEQVSFDKFNDPVRMYLREMGSESLLNREEEVEIAKRIEAGEQEITQRCLECTHHCQ